MSQPINLSQVRKARAKAAAKTTADSNAAKFGRSGAARELDKARAEKAVRDLDGAQTEPE